MYSLSGALYVHSHARNVIQLSTSFILFVPVINLQHLLCKVFLFSPSQFFAPQDPPSVKIQSWNYLVHVVTLAYTSSPLIYVPFYLLPTSIRYCCPSHLSYWKRHTLSIFIDFLSLGNVVTLKKQAGDLGTKVVSCPV